MQSQIVCHACRSVLLYSRGESSVCCALCHAITTVTPPAERAVPGTMEGPSEPSQVTMPSEDHAASCSSQHVAMLKKLLFRRMLVGVNDGRYFLGLFHCIDKQGNIILQDAVEYRSTHRSSLPPKPTEQRCLGLILIPAACRSSCHVDCFIEEKMSLLSLDK